MNNLSLIVLLKKYLENTISKAETNQLKKLLKEEKNKKIAKAFLEQQYREQSIEQDFSVKTSFEKLLGRITLPKQRRNTRPAYYKYAAAVLILIGLGIFVNYNNSKSFKSALPINTADNRVTLTMDDGTEKTLSTESSDSISGKANQFLATVDQGVLAYKHKTNKSRKVNYNTLSVPNGKRFVVKLSDGTVAQMNSGSVLKYPVNFSGLDKREVFLEGEAFFDVTKNSEKKFIVNTNAISIAVLGTRFNVNAYGDENTIKTTLEEGSVVVLPKKGDQTLYLKPNEQAVWDIDNKTNFKHTVDINDHVAWKDGTLIFKKTNFTILTKRLERYYNVKITNTNQQLRNKRFTAKFENKELEDILFYMSKIIDFEYTIQDSGVIIK